MIERTGSLIHCTPATEARRFCSEKDRHLARQLRLMPESTFAQDECPHCGRSEDALQFQVTDGGGVRGVTLSRLEVEELLPYLKAFVRTGHWTAHPKPAEGDASDG